MKKIINIVLCCFLAALIFVLPSSHGFAQHNDPRYDNYKNMGGEGAVGQTYIVPSIYRQDASYNNVKLFPLVVSNSVEYFPLDIFTQFNFLEVKNSELVYGFYINNKRNNHYIAVNLETGASSTHDNSSANIDVHIFNRTYYLPAKVVCEALGLKFETYDDYIGGIRAARVSDGTSKSTLSDLIRQYSPSGEDVPIIEDPTITDVPISPDDPYGSVAGRNVYLTFENCLNSNIYNILNVLEYKSAKATFFVDRDGILSYPDAVRRIIAEGHTFGIYINPVDESGQTLTNEQILKIAEEANEALSLVAKTSTRIIRTSAGSSSLLEEQMFEQAAKEAGYVLYGWTAIAKDYSGKTANAICSELLDGIIGRNKNIRQTSFVTFGSYRQTASVLKYLLDFCSRYKQFNIFTYNEYTQVPVFPAW